MATTAALSGRMPVAPNARNGKRIACVGAGPASMTVARDLAPLGYEVVVFDGEPKIHQGYYGLENAFLLPHMGSATVETRNAMGFKALDNLEAFLLSGLTPPDLVNPS